MKKLTHLQLEAPVPLLLSALAGSFWHLQDGLGFHVLLGIALAAALAGSVFFCGRVFYSGKLEGFGELDKAIKGNELPSVLCCEALPGPGQRVYIRRWSPEGFSRWFGKQCWVVGSFVDSQDCPDDSLEKRRN